IGSGTNPVAFSFYATKNLTTAEGGMLTGEGAFLDRARVLSLHGMSRDAWKRYDQGGSWRYDVLLPGSKYSRADTRAGIGLCQLRKQDASQRRRREIVARYTAAFAAEQSLEPPVVRAEVEPAWHLYVLRLRPEALRIGRDRFIEELTARNIGTSVHFIPVHLHPYYRDKYGYALDADIVFVIGWSQILHPPTLRLARSGMIGAHASLLPHNRGSAPINWALIRGERHAGNSLLWLAEDVDGGAVIDQTTFCITAYDTCASLYERVAASNRDMLLGLVPRLLAGERPGR